jgi:hypothetical protein
MPTTAVVEGTTEEVVGGVEVEGTTEEVVDTTEEDIVVVVDGMAQAFQTD